MKALLTLLIVTTLSPAVVAKSKPLTCDELANFAEQVMSMRQAETSITDVLKLAEYNIERKVVLEAYKQVAYTDRQFSNDQRVNFKNAVLTQCYEYELKKE